MSRLIYIFIFLLVSNSYARNGSVEFQSLFTTVQSEHYVRGLKYSPNLGVGLNVRADNWKYFFFSYKISLQTIGYSWKYDGDRGWHSSLILGWNPFALNFRYKSVVLSTSPYSGLVLKRFNAPEESREFDFKIDLSHNWAVGFDIDLYYRLNKKNGLSLGMPYRYILWRDYSLAGYSFTRVSPNWYVYGGFKLSYERIIF